MQSEKASPIRRDLRHTTGKQARVKRAFQFALDLLYPSRCAGCRRVDARWCVSCQQELDAVAFDLCGGRTASLTGFAATGIHEGKLQEAVHALKYTGTHELAVPLGERLIRALETLGWQIDIIMPVPLHNTRQRERGANQAELLTNYVAITLNLPYSHDTLTRLRDTPAQVGLNREQRLENVRGAFQANRPISGTVLLVDDVFTTGATLQACAQAAHEAGADVVYGLTVSMARSPNT